MQHKHHVNYQTRNPFFLNMEFIVLLKKNYHEYFCENITTVNNDKLLIINFSSINKSHYLKYGIYVFN